MQQATSIFRLFRKLGNVVLSHAKRPWIAGGVMCVLLVGTGPLALAQITDNLQTQATTKKKKTPLDLVLRSIAVLEWTGPADKPTTSLLIPVAVYTDDHYMDGGDYLADPVPLSVENGTQYVLEKSGVPQGNYDLNAAGKMRGDWFGSGTWEQLHAKNPYALVAASGSARPHFGADSPSDAPPLPKLHRRPSPDAPTTPPPDPARPIMAYGKPPQKSLADFTQTTPVAHHQMIAISDAATRDVHPLAYAWSDPSHKEAMEQKVQALAEKILQQALQPKPPTDTSTIEQTAASDQPKDTTPHLVQRPKPKPVVQAGKQTPASAPSTSQLAPVDFRCFALAYKNNPSKATPTCVWSGETAPQVTPKRYVTVITQQDIYGAPQLISQSETDETQLATHPRVQLVDAVDGAANHNAELMIEIDEAGSRQFGLYNVSDSKVKLAYVTKKLPF